jgi:hypothetical protein
VHIVSHPEVLSGQEANGASTWTEIGRGRSSRLNSRTPAR